MLCIYAFSTPHIFDLADPYFRNDVGATPTKVIFSWCFNVLGVGHEPGQHNCMSSILWESTLREKIGYMVYDVISMLIWPLAPEERKR